MNTHESYVSLEVAKLLKQAGFDWECNRFYDCTNSDCVRYEEYPAPTLAVAQRWLREVKNKNIDVLRLYGCYHYIINDSDAFCSGPVSGIQGEFTIYEEALEAGIKKCLEIILENDDK